MNKSQAIHEFRECYLPEIREMYEQDGIPDYIARSEEWNNYTDMLCKDGRITTHQYETWAHPAFCGQ